MFCSNSRNCSAFSSSVPLKTSSKLAFRQKSQGSIPYAWTQSAISLCCVSAGTQSVREPIGRKLFAPSGHFSPLATIRARSRQNRVLPIDGSREENQDAFGQPLIPDIFRHLTQLDKVISRCEPGRPTP